MAQTVAQHPVSAFTSPVNGTTPIDANTVRGNDNTLRVAYVDHDADPGIHLQSSALASRPVASSAGRKWLTADSSSYRLFFDDGSNWQELSYLRTDAGGTITGNLTLTGNLVVEGNTTLGNAAGDTVTVTGRVASNVEFSADNTYDVGASGANRPRTLYASTSVVTPLVTATTLGGTLSTAAQPNIGSVAQSFDIGRIEHEAVTTANVGTLRIQSNEKTYPTDNANLSLFSLSKAAASGGSSHSGFCGIIRIAGVIRGASANLVSYTWEAYFNLTQNVTDAIILNTWNVALTVTAQSAANINVASVAVNLTGATDTAATLNVVVDVTGTDAAGAYTYSQVFAEIDGIRRAETAAQLMTLTRT